MVQTPYCTPTRRVPSRRGINLRPVPNRFSSYEGWCEYHSSDLPRLSKDDLRRDLTACDLAIRLCAPHADPWYFERCVAIRAHIEGERR